MVVVIKGTHGVIKTYRKKLILQICTASPHLYLHNYNIYIYIYTTLNNNYICKFK